MKLMILFLFGIFLGYLIGFVIGSERNNGA